MVHGNNGNDRIDGQGGVDKLYGDDGDDLLLGGTNVERPRGRQQRSPRRPSSCMAVPVTTRCVAARG